MKLIALQGELAIARLDATDDVPAWAWQGSVSSITRTADELSVVCGAAAVPESVRAERHWRGLRVVGTLDFSLTGVLASLATPLATAGISIFAISTFDTDYLLVREHLLATAIEILAAEGHEILAG